ncbi:MAG: hypothetical protein IT246_05875, partial [Bacteroidia bacterium]|nr:hypothetical protein [Bacteroidia bacterium]
MKTNFTLNSKKLLLAIVTSFFITLSSKSVAQTITSTTSGGLWSSASTWIGGVVPTSTNDVVINGTVFINNSVSCRNITINAGDTLVDYNTSAVLTVLGNITNNGVVGRNVSNYYNVIDVKGNIENNGIWKPYKTTLSGVNMQFLQQSAGKRFEGVWAITDTNSFVKLNSNVVFGGNENFDLN